MDWKKILLAIAIAPLIIAAGIAIMMLSYLIVPVFIAVVGLLIGYAVVSIILEDKDRS